MNQFSNSSNIKERLKKSFIYSFIAFLFILIFVNFSAMFSGYGEEIEPRIGVLKHLNFVYCFRKSYVANNKKGNIQHVREENAKSMQLIPHHAKLEKIESLFGKIESRSSHDENIHLYSPDPEMVKKVVALLKLSKQPCFVYEGSFDGFNKDKHKIFIINDFNISQSFMLNENIFNKPPLLEQDDVNQNYVIVVAISSKPLCKHYLDHMQIQLTDNVNQDCDEKEMIGSFLHDKSVKSFDRISIVSMYSNVLEMKITDDLIETIQKELCIDNPIIEKQDNSPSKESSCSEQPAN